MDAICKPCCFQMRPNHPHACEDPDKCGCGGDHNVVIHCGEIMAVKRFRPVENVPPNRFL